MHEAPRQSTCAAAHLVQEVLEDQEGGMRGLGGLKYAPDFRMELNWTRAGIAQAYRTRFLHQEGRRNMPTASGRAVRHDDHSLDWRENTVGRRDKPSATKNAALSRENHRPLKRGLGEVGDKSKQFAIVSIAQQVPMESYMGRRRPAYVFGFDLESNAKANRIAERFHSGRIPDLDLQPWATLSQGDLRGGLSGARASLGTLGSDLGQPQLAEDEPKSDAVQNDSRPSGNSIILFDPPEHLRKRRQPEQSDDSCCSDRAADNAVLPRFHSREVAGVGGFPQAAGPCP